MTLLGYARSGDDLAVSRQVAELQDAGCERIWQDVGGAHALDDLLGAATEGDVIVVTHLDRLTRDPRMALELVEERGLHIRELLGALDTTQPAALDTLRYAALTSQGHRDHVERTRHGIAESDAGRQDESH